MVEGKGEDMGDAARLEGLGEAPAAAVKQTMTRRGRQENGEGGEEEGLRVRGRA